VTSVIAQVLPREKLLDEAELAEIGPVIEESMAKVRMIVAKMVERHGHP
jgi:hypothetical protein